MLDQEFNNVLYKREDNFNDGSVDRMAELYQEIIELTGEDLSREGLVKTPKRVSKAMHFITQGYKMNPHEIIKSAMFKEAHSEMVVVKDIELYSVCEHHMFPFYGRAHVAYIPDKHVTGLSKIARVVDVYARRLQVQERLTWQIMNCIDETLKPLGVAVVIEAKHLCMMMRGVEKQNSVTTTSAFTGEFKNHSTRSEFINLISAKLS